MSDVGHIHIIRMEMDDDIVGMVGLDVQLNVSVWKLNEMFVMWYYLCDDDLWCDAMSCDMIFVVWIFLCFKQNMKLCIEINKIESSMLY